jgi:hypothetical protein
LAYSKEEIEIMFNSICYKIEVEGLALRNVLKLENTPSSRTFSKWLREDVNKVKQYTRATDGRADKIFEDILNIADATAEDIITSDEGQPITNHNVIQRDRLRVDTRKWYLSKLNPKKYSDKIQVDNTEFKEQPLFNTDDE